MLLVRIIVYGHSMKPTMHDKEFWLAELKSRKKVCRGDIIRIKGPNVNPITNTNSIVKRVIGLENDEIIIKNGIVYINGIPETHNFGKTKNLDGSKEKRYRVRKNQVFVLGDNRAISNDSRQFGLLKLPRKVFIVKKELYRGTTYTRKITFEQFQTMIDKISEYILKEWFKR